MKKKINKKSLIYFCIVVLIILSVFGVILYQENKKHVIEKKQVSLIKNSYSNYVTVTKDKKVYQKNKDSYKVIGMIYKGTMLEIDKPTVVSSEDIYFNISNSDYYIDYLNIKKSDKIKEDKSLDKYVVTKTVKTVPTNLYQDDVLKWKLDGSYDFDVLAVLKDKYYVRFLGQIYQIKDNFQLIDKENKSEVLEKISVLNFSNDISTGKLNEILAYLKQENYNTITVDDFDLWINGNVQLPNKTVLLISYSELSDEKKELVNSYEFCIDTKLDTISFTSGDKQLKIGDITYYKYEVNSNTSLDRVKDMLTGVVEKKPVVDNSGVAVLNYHFFYDDKTEICDETICISTENFRKQLSYLKENGYKALTMKEFNDWMDKKIEIPNKSVLITIDDGAAGTYTHLPQILEEYQMHATLFLITGWWPVARYKTAYLEVQSHGNNLHDSNYCDSAGCGYKTLKLSKELLKEDLKESINLIGSNIAFCYPFYKTNNNLVDAIKESGFSLGFVGGNKKATRSNNKYYVPRHIIYKNTSLNSFIKMVS